jgi:uncharacterized protein YjbI with pentapeptide repeats
VARRLHPAAVGAIDKAGMAGLNLAGAYLKGFNLRDANLEGANLKGAHLFGVNLARANLTEASLFDADLSEANLSGTILKHARYNANTIWPVGFDPKAHGAVLVHKDNTVELPKS